MIHFSYECTLEADDERRCTMTGSISTDLEVDGDAWDFVRCLLYVCGRWTCTVWVDGDAPQTRKIAVRRAPHGGLVRHDFEVLV